MKISSEKEKGRTIIKSEDKQHTIMSLMRKYLWRNGTDSGYDEGHPYLGGSKLVIDSEDVGLDVEEAIEDIKADLEDFRKSFEA